VVLIRVILLEAKQVPNFSEEETHVFLMLNSTSILNTRSSFYSIPEQKVC
jgi:hypothetical protein